MKHIFCIIRLTQKLFRIFIFKYIYMITQLFCLLKEEMITETSEFFQCKIIFYQTHGAKSMHNWFCEYFMHVLLTIVFKKILFIYINH